MVWSPYPADGQRAYCVESPGTWGGVALPQPGGQYTSYSYGQNAPGVGAEGQILIIQPHRGHSSKAPLLTHITGLHVIEEVAGGLVAIGCQPMCVHAAWVAAKAPNKSNVTFCADI